MRWLLVLLGLVSLTLVGLAGGAAAGGGGCHEAQGDEATATIVMYQACMQPGVARVNPGETVTVLNEDEMFHNLYGPGWFHGDLAPGERATRTFEEPGTYTYGCTLHAGMTGAVVVGDDPELISASAADAGTDAGGMSGGTAMVLTVAGIAAVALVFAGGLTAGRRR